MTRRASAEAEEGLAGLISFLGPQGEGEEAGGPEGKHIGSSLHFNRQVPECVPKFCSLHAEIYVDTNVGGLGTRPGPALPGGGLWSDHQALGTGRTRASRGFVEVALEEILSSLLTPERNFLFQGLWTLWGAGVAWVGDGYRGKGSQSQSRLGVLCVCMCPKCPQGSVVRMYNARKNINRVVLNLQVLNEIGHRCLLANVKAVGGAD